MKTIMAVLAMAILTSGLTAGTDYQRIIAGINYGTGTRQGIRIQPFPQRLTPVVVPNAMGLMDAATVDNPLIIQIRLFGVIGLPEFGGVSPEMVDEIIYQLSNPPMSNFKICGILLLIDSPGGFFIAAEQVFNAIINYKQRHKLPVVTFIESTAASGGYLIACAGDAIFASSLSVAGSIGVITSPYFNYGSDNILFTEASDGLKTMNINPIWQILRRGPWIHRGLPWEPWGADEFEREKKVIATSYEILLETIAKHRPQLSVQVLRDDIAAGVYFDSAALAKKLIDVSPATREDALKALVEVSNCGDNYRIIEFIQQ